MKKEEKKKNSKMTTMTTMMNQAWKMVEVLFTYKKVFFWLIFLVYNEDLEEDNSDWNDVEGDEEDEDIDSDGKKKSDLMLLKII